MGSGTINVSSMVKLNLSAISLPITAVCKSASVSTLPVTDRDSSWKKAGVTARMITGSPLTVS